MILFKIKFLKGRYFFMKKVVLSVVGILFFCSVASAISVTPFFKIVRDYEADSSKAYSKWWLKEICIEGEIQATNLVNQNFIVMLGKEYKGTKYNLVSYRFVYNPLFRLQGIQALKKGQRVKLTGNVQLFEERTDSGYHMLIIEVIGSGAKIVK